MKKLLCSILLFNLIAGLSISLKLKYAKTLDITTDSSILTYGDATNNDAMVC